MTSRRPARWIIFCLAALAWGSIGLTEARAQFTGGIVTNSPGLPPGPSPPAAYMSGSQIHAAYMALGIEITNVVHDTFTNVTLQFGNVGPNGENGELETFQSKLSGDAYAIGPPLTPLGPFDLTGSVSVFIALRTSNTETGIFNTQMTNMDLTGSAGGMKIEVITDPTTASTGMVSIQPLGGNEFKIQSFFDIFTDLSIGGSAFDPSTGPTLVTLQSIPEPSTWIMLATAGLMVPAYARWRRGRV